MPSKLMRCGWVTALSVLIASMNLPAPQAARAAYNPCQSTLAATFAGRTTAVSSQVYEGVSGTLTYQSDALCTSYLGNDNYTTTWTMVYGKDENGWSQSGQIYWYQLGCARHFSQVEENYVYFPYLTVTGVCAQTGETHQAWQQYIPQDGNLRSNIDATIMQTTSFNPYTAEGSFSGSGWAQPFQVEVEGETGRPQSDVPGTSSAPSTFVSIQVQRYSDSSWETTCNYNAVFNDDTSLTRYSQYPPTCDQVDVWTNNPSGP